MISGHREIEPAIRSLNMQAEAVLDAEFLRALHICDAVAVVEGPLGFLPDRTATTPETWDAAWHSWLAGAFAETVAPTLLAVTRFAHAGQYREIAAADQNCSQSFDASVTGRSKIAGNKMLKRLSAARGVRWLDRLQAAVVAGSTPGHFAVAYGCQGALFHLNPRVVLGTYAYWEWVAAAAATHRRQPDAVSAFQAISAPVLRRITDAMLTSQVTHADERSRVSL